jgi:hypothetical protein
MLMEQQGVEITAAAIRDAQTDCKLGDRTAFQFMRALYRTGVVDEDAWRIYAHVYAEEAHAWSAQVPPAR